MTAEREGLVEEIAGVLREHMTMGTSRRYVVTYGITPEDFADALADLLAARDRRVRSEAVRSAAALFDHEDEATNVALSGVDYVIAVLRDRADRIENAELAQTAAATEENRP